MKTQKEVVQKVIDWSIDNSSGTILSKTAIEKVISECYKNLTKCNAEFVDNLIAENESTRHDKTIN
jgi:predicted nucleic-acid-binding protein